jgi:hypothetical protein
VIIRRPWAVVVSAHASRNKAAQQIAARPRQPIQPGHYQHIVTPEARNRLLAKARNAKMHIIKLTNRVDVQDIVP